MILRLISYQDKLTVLSLNAPKQPFFTLASPVTLEPQQIFWNLLFGKMTIGMPKLVQQHSCGWCIVQNLLVLQAVVSDHFGKLPQTAFFCRLFNLLDNRINTKGFHPVLQMHQLFNNLRGDQITTRGKQLP